MKFALGTVQFGLNYGVANVGGQVSSAEVQNIIDLCKSHRIDTLDTAIAYGESEKVLGNMDVSDFKLITKLPPIPRFELNVGNWVNEMISGSLSRLRIPRLYGLMLHAPTDLESDQGQSLYDALVELKKLGKVAKIGVSIYDPLELDRVFSKYPVDIVQAPFSIIDQRMLTSGWLKKLKEQNVEIHTRSAFLQGSLLMPRQKLPTYLKKWNQVWDQVDDWLGKNDFNRLSGALAFLNYFEEIDRVVVGVDSATQLSEIIQNAHLTPQIVPRQCASEDLDLINPSNWKLS